MLKLFSAFAIADFNNFSMTLDAYCDYMKQLVDAEIDANKMQ